jgi:hypothetical protein
MRRRPAVVTLTLALVAAPLLPAASPALAASPTVAVASSRAMLSAGETATLTFVFSEPVRGFDVADVLVSGGTIGSPSGSGTTYTTTFTPAPGFEGTARVEVVGSGVTDDQGVPGTGSSWVTMTVDTLAPTPAQAISFSDTALRAGEQSTVTFAFSEAVSGFSTADVTVPNASLSFLSSSDGGLTWTALLTPAPGVQDTTNSLSVDLAGLRDRAGNPGVGTWSSGSYAVDTVSPAATVEVADTDLAPGDTTTVTFRFSEVVTGFTLADTLPENGVLAGLRSADGGLTWTATLMAAGGASAPSNQVRLFLAGVADLAGNAGTGTALSNAYAVGTTAPTAVVTLSDAVLRAGTTSTVTIAFSEAVSGFTVEDLTAGLGTLSAPSSTDGGVTWTATLTPTADAEDPAQRVVLDLTGVRNGDGTAGSGVARSDPYAVDTRRPTATVDVAPPVVGIGGTAAVTITFSEPVTGVVPAVTTAGGTLTGLASADAGVTWTATFVPAAATETTTGAVRVDTAAVRDAVGNAGVGVESSVPLTVDTVAPTATLRLATTRVTGPTTLTVTFSEPVTTLTPANLVATRGTLSGLATADGGRTWTATFTPDAGVSADAITIRLDLPGVTDRAGNPGAAAVLSAAFAVETPAGTVPTAPVPAVPAVPAAPAPVAAAPAAAAAAPAPSATRPALARTGSDALALLGAAAALLATGFAAVRIRTRRTRTTD